MTSPSFGLTEKDLAILAYYVKTRNRERYWNYLATRPGDDGYGDLALGVVRNDNMPGATANLYAKTYAKEHNGRVLTEREWDNFGVDLIGRDLLLRRKQFERSRPDLALNLPVRKVQEAHDLSFNNINIDPNAWTPRKALEALRLDERGAEVQTEALWKSMLNNRFLGMPRLIHTLSEIATVDSLRVAERAIYSKDMSAAYFSALDQWTNQRPHFIGDRKHYFARERDGAWIEIMASPMSMNSSMGATMDEPLMRDVTDPAERAQLEDTYQLRREREKARDATHPDDTSQLVPSQHPLTHVVPRASAPLPGEDPLYSNLRQRLPMEVSNDQVALLSCHVRRYESLRPISVNDAQLEDNQMVVTMPHKRVTLSMDVPAPPKEFSMEQAQQLDADAREQAIERQISFARQLAMERRGHSLSR
ncbi:hypothetical protein FHW69_003581 [Luteibacter sp. Sphag1AF]|uniref:hypothetical protein n=1 Tax=Luteibacter sp. Sphag1AF TaxID=2587031 RepID=UPI0016168C08|nr:hypothetical protein [Luteibacter sp. Sphag1AF]MBB3228933.1 hypothetical protein [Luteibacter sp. Sphag1AF]